MRKLRFAILLLWALPGCTNLQLKRSTVDQASTLTDLQYRQVLSNLAMFSKNPSAIPFHINVRDGSAQVTDTGSVGLIGGFGRSMGDLASGTPSLSGSRTVVDQWSMVPITDDEELKLLSMAYLNAFGLNKTLTEDEGFANDLGHELAKQSEVTLEFFQDNALFQAEQNRMASTTVKVEPNAPPPAPGTNTERIAPITYRLFEKTMLTTVDKCLKCDLGKPRNHEVWIEATRTSRKTKQQTYLFNHGGGDRNLVRLKVRKGDYVKWTNNDDQLHGAKFSSSAFCFDTGMLRPGESSACVPFPVASGADGFVYCDDQGNSAGTIVVTDGDECEDDEAGEARLRTVLYNGVTLDNKLPTVNSVGDSIIEEPVSIEVGDTVTWINRGQHPIDIEVFDVSTNSYKMHHKDLLSNPDINMSRDYFYSGFATQSAFIPRFFFRITDKVTWKTMEGQVAVRHKRVQSPLVKEVCRQLSDVNDDLKEIPSGWFHVGGKKDVPKDALYAGRYGDRCTWVTADGLEDLSKFTLKVLSLSSVLKDRQVVTGSGVRYSPGLSNPVRF
jgi:plastocyanin